MKKLKFLGCIAVGSMAITSFLLANNSNQKRESNLDDVEYRLSSCLFIRNAM